MDLIIALLLLIYYVGRKSIDKSEIKMGRKRFEDDLQARLKRRDEFIAKYCDEDLEDELREACVNTNDDYKRIAKLIASKGISVHPGMVLMAWMAEHKKILGKHAEKGIRNIVMPIDCSKKEKMTKATEHWKFIRWYADYCKSNGIDEPLYFSPFMGYLKQEQWSLEGWEEYDIARNGVFVWAPMDHNFPSGADISIYKT